VANVIIIVVDKVGAGGRLLGDKGGVEGWAGTFFSRKQTHCDFL
jgi:hypothetical protein